MMHSALRVSVLITPHTSCMLHIFAIISSIIKTRTARVMAIPLIVVMIEARMRRIRLQGTPLPPPAVPRIQVQVITVVAVGVNMSACGKSCFIVQCYMVKVQMHLNIFILVPFTYSLFCRFAPLALTSVAHTKRISAIISGIRSASKYFYGYILFHFVSRCAPPSYMLYLDVHLLLTSSLIASYYLQ